MIEKETLIIDNEIKNNISSIKYFYASHFERKM